MTRYPAQFPARPSLKNTWYLMIGLPPVYALLGNLIGPLRTSYFVQNFYYLFFVLSCLIVFFVIPGVRKWIFKKAGGNAWRAEKRASFATWGLAQCIALFGVSAYLMAADKGTFYGLLIGSLIILFNFRPRDILQ